MLKRTQFLHALFTLVIASLPLARGDIAADTLLYPACVGFTLAAGWIFWSWHHVGRIGFEPYTIFLVSCTLFSGGQVLLEVMHLNPNGILNGAFPQEVLLQSVYIITLGMVSVHLGVLWTLQPTKRSAETPTIRIQTAFELRAVGCVMIVAAAGPASSLMWDAAIAAYSSGYFFAMFQNESIMSASSTKLILANLLVPGALFVLAGSESSKWLRYSSVCITMIYSASFLFIGSRRQPVASIVAYTWLWDHCVQRIPRSRIVTCGCVLLFIVSPLLAVTRVIGGDRQSVETVMDAFISIQNPGIAGVAEMGKTLFVVAYVLTYVPSIHPYEYGVDYLYGALTALPNIGEGRHPTVARGTLGDWVVNLADPTLARTGGGLGSSFIAEAYANFGWLGTPIALLAVGFLISVLLSIPAAEGSRRRTALAAVALSILLTLPRNDVSGIFRAIVWYALLPYLAVTFLARSRNSA